MHCGPGNSEWEVVCSAEASLSKCGVVGASDFSDRKASFNHGMNPHVYITYRHIVSGLVMFPFAYVLERVGLTLNMYFASLRYTSPTFIASMVNTIASLTFVIAVVLSLVLDLRSPSRVRESFGNPRLLSRCNDHDIVQGAYGEIFMASIDPYSREILHP
ncbi:hypothetical protein Prudu_000228 [Prunus dulcis]|uniref:Uncharacterized protein n=1 Tax=Prunus dulcis TaxID=3755 RepID=A0A4Y1QKS6_PRUDU|nr:hypothetical protein Prudu_000228 [Prunus dulcis]